MIIISNPAEVIGKEVAHRGDRIGTVTLVKPNMDKGRRYALVRPLDLADQERRLPLDELELV